VTTEQTSRIDNERTTKTKLMTSARGAALLARGSARGAGDGEEGSQSRNH